MGGDASKSPVIRTPSKSVDANFANTFDDMTTAPESPRAPDESTPSYARGTKRANTMRGGGNSSRKVC